MHRGDVDSIEAELKKLGGVPFVVWAKAMATLSAEEIQELIIRAGRKRIAEAEARGLPIYQYGTGKHNRSRWRPEEEEEENGNQKVHR